MNPLTITWAPHLYTDIGRQNVESLAHEGGIDNILLHLMAYCIDILLVKHLKTFCILFNHSL